jgi:membrane AbrB-like protein
VPAGVILGTLVAVSAVSVGGTLLGLPLPPLPPGIDGLMQVLLGMMVGLRIDRDSLRLGVHALVPAFLLAAIIIPTAVIAALVAAPLTSVDVVTFIFAAAPGGLTEMSLMSVAFGAYGTDVVVVQLLRLHLVRRALAGIDALLRRPEAKGGSGFAPRYQEEQQDDALAVRTGYKEDLKRFGVAAPWGVLGGVIGFAIWAPAGGIIGALLGSAAFGLLTGRDVPIEKFRLGVQALAGGTIGLADSGEFVVSGGFFGELVRHVGAAAMIISVQMLLWLATSWLLVKRFNYDLSTATLASSPGEISEAVPVAEEVGAADAAVVSFIHLVRVSTIVVVVPIFVALVVGR